MFPIMLLLALDAPRYFGQCGIKVRADHVGDIFLWYEGRQ